MAAQVLLASGRGDDNQRVRASTFDCRSCRRGTILGVNWGCRACVALTAKPQAVGVSVGGVIAGLLACHKPLNSNALRLCQPMRQMQARVADFARLHAMLLVENLKKSYLEPSGEQLAILDVPHFELAAGEQAVIRGRSGGGKTTLLNVIAGLATADEGRIVVNGTDVSRLPEAVRDRFRARHIGFVFQTFNLLAGFSALENVLLGMTFTGQPSDTARARDLLMRVGLGPRLSHKPAALSVGEQQRVAVARALVNRPGLLLADEPTANIDPAHQQQVIDLLREVCRVENVAMLLVTHSDEVAGQFDRVEHLEELNRVVAAVA